MVDGSATRILIRGLSCVPLICAAWLTTAAADEVAEAARLTDELARAAVDEIMPRVAEIRGLEFKQPVPVQVIDDEAARRHLLERLEQFDAVEQMKSTQRAYALLELVKPDADILESYLAAMREQAGGFYDPTTRSYYLLGDMPAAMATLLTAHELTHALEDQHHDLDRRLEEVIDDDDRLFARSAVHEGSATLLMSLFAVQGLMDGSVTRDEMEAASESEAAQGAGLDALPPVLLRQLMGPYVLGASFLAGGNLLAGMTGGFPVERVERAYADGPESSEQILHPEKYWGNTPEGPRPVDLADVGELLGRKWKRASGGVLGELTLGVMVGAPTPLDPASMMTVGASAWTNDAASGWGGDRWELWSRGKHSVVVLLTVWDSAEDAGEFAAALPADAGYDWRRAGDRVAVVGGKADGAADLLTRMLETDEAAVAE